MARSGSGDEAAAGNPRARRGRRPEPGGKGLHGVRTRAQLREDARLAGGAALPGPSVSEEGSSGEAVSDASRESVVESPAVRGAAAS